EFLHPRTKHIVKPAIELMAGLPSVVLGFLAGLVFAQFVEGVLPAIMAFPFAMALTFLLAAQLWQLLPERITLALQRWRFVCICLVLPIGVFAASLLGPIFETVFFGGDWRHWLASDAQDGKGAGGWALLLLPVAIALWLFALGGFINPKLRPHL